MWKMYKQSLESSGGNAAAGILEAEADNSLSTEECLRTARMRQDNSCKDILKILRFIVREHEAFANHLLSFHEYKYAIDRLFVSVFAE